MHCGAMVMNAEVNIVGNSGGSWQRWVLITYGGGMGGRRRQRLNGRRGKKGCGKIGKEGGNVMIGRESG